MTNVDPLAPLAVSVEQTRKILGIGLSKTWELVRTNQLESFKLDNKRLILLKSIHELVERKRLNQSQR